VAAEGGRVGRVSGQGSVNCLQHTVQILIDIVIPKSKHTKTRTHQFLIALAVVFRVTIEVVLTAVNLDDNVMLQAHEVDDIAFARGLPPEMISALSPGAKMIPNFHLLRGEGFA
jgi:hypothetical protein